MATRRWPRVLGALAALVATSAPPAAHAAVLPGTGCPVLPGDSWWHADVRSLPLHPMSATYVASMGATKHVHADFGSGTWDGGPIGIPYVVVDGQPPVPVTFAYDDESDHVPYPIPPDAPIEGGPSATGDRHVLVVDAATCHLYELYDATPDGSGGWTAGSGATWDLRSNALRPDTWTSADAAGLPILPGLVRYEEVAAGHVDHAIRVTASATSKAHLWPARHDAGSANAALPPMGLRLRLRADVDTSGMRPAAQVIAQAMKTYGVVVADNGSSWFISGAPDERWANDVLHDLDGLSGQDFEAVDTSGLLVDPDSAQVKGGAAPVPAPAPGAPPAAEPAWSRPAPPTSAAPTPTEPAPTTSAAPMPAPLPTTSAASTPAGTAAERAASVGVGGEKGGGGPPIGAWAAATAAVGAVVTAIALVARRVRR